ncbi:MAG: DSD1 family PLP-dependent enzyme [Dehalococcoidia bacterium]|nr:DSD1 family PLP-dependent enzyme [Dehalococcoidia bacterium]
MTHPRTLSDIPTPALIVDVPAMERNIRRMAEFFAAGACRLRPHFKAHKTLEIARRQLAAGSCTGLTCATVAEAEAASDFCDDILIANQVIGPDKTARVAALAKRTDVKIAADSVYGLEEMAAAAQRAGVTVGIVIDVNVGMPRCGVAPGEEALALARRAAGLSGLRLRGVMGYEGHVVAIEDRGEREARARKAMERLLTSAQMMREAGLACDIVSAGGTGTYDITGRVEGVTEVQAGSYVLMDTAYAKLDIPFEKAFSVLGTVLSRPAPGLCVTDSGHKACTQDHGNPAVKDAPGASVLFLSDEHASIAIPPDSPVRPGDRIQLWPSHTDPTINLHDVLYALEGETVVGVWPVTARGYAEQRHG